MEFDEKLIKLGLTIPQAPAKGGAYEPAKAFGENLYYLSGCGPNLNRDGAVVYAGVLGREYDVEAGRQAARCCALNLLAVFLRDVGDFSKIKSIVKMIAFVACTDDFYDQPKVADGASLLLAELFGSEAGRPARSAVGTNALPNNFPVEIELLIEVFP